MGGVGATDVAVICTLLFRVLTVCSPRISEICAEAWGQAVMRIYLLYVTARFLSPWIPFIHLSFPIENVKSILFPCSLLFFNL